MKHKSLIFLISAVLILCTAWNINASAAETEEKEQLAYSVLSDLGIYTEENGAYDADRTVTRGEFACIASRLTGVEIPHMTVKSFGDVPANHKYFDGIYYAMSKGILKGDAYGSFRPDENVKYEEMTAVIIRILGYEPMVETGGLYPDGYIKKAGELWLLKDVGGSAGADISFADMTMMLYNALEADCCTADLIGANSGYHVEKGNNLLKQSFNIVKARGVVTGNNVTRLTSADAMPEGTIEIDNDEFICTDKNAHSLLGYPVEYYYEDRSGGMVLKHIHAREERELVIDADLIEAVSVNAYRYYPDEKSSSIRTASISRRADIIYNGKAASDTDGILIPKTGGVRLIDNDFDGTYDVIFIDEYYNIVIGSVSWSNYTVYDKYDPSRKMDLRSGEEYELVTVIDESGMTIPFDELREWDVLSVSATKDGGGYAKIVVNYSELSGIVTAVGSDANDRTAYTIGGETYSVSADMPDAAAPLDVMNKQVTAGRDMFGKIAYIRTVSANKENMGYLMWAHCYKEDDGEDNLRVKIFSMAGEELVLDGADKIKVDDVRVDEADAIKYLTDENGTKNGMVVYKTNSNGELSMIDTAYAYGAAPPEGESEDSIHVLYPKAKLRYKKNMKSFGGKLCISQDTAFLYVPMDKTETRQYRILDLSYFVNDDDYDIEAYAVDGESLSAEVLIVHGTGAEAIDGSSAPILVQNVVITINEDEEKVHYLCGYSLDKDKGYQELYAVDDKLLQNVRPGDVIRCGLDSTGAIEKLEWVYDADRERFGAYADPENTDEPQNRFGTIGNFTDQYRVIFGAVYKKNGDYIAVTTDDSFSGNAEKEVFPASGFKIYRVEPSRSKASITEIDAAEMTDYKSTMNTRTNILMYTRYAEPKSIVIYEND